MYICIYIYFSKRKEVFRLVSLALEAVSGVGKWIIIQTQDFETSGVSKLAILH
jgi:hypothetical protein